MVIASKVVMNLIQADVIKHLHTLMEVKWMAASSRHFAPTSVAERRAELRLAAGLCTSDKFPLTTR